MRVVLDARRSSGSGIGRYTQCVIEAFSSSDELRQRYELVQLVSGSGDGDRVVTWESPLLSDWQGAVLAKLLRELRADVFLAPQYYLPIVDVVPTVRVLHDAHPFWTDYASPSLNTFNGLYGGAELRRVASQIGLRSWPEDQSGSKERSIARLIQAMYRVGADHARELVTVSSFSARELTEYMPSTAGRWSVIHPFVTRRLARTEASTEQPWGSPAILAVSKLEPRKNQLALIDAVIRIRERHPGARLTLVGGATASFPRYAESVRKAATRHGQFTRLLDGVSDERLGALYRSCSVFVSASVSEGFGFPGLEALEAGAEVLVGRSTSMPEVYGKRAHYFDESGLRSESGSQAYEAAVAELANRLSALLHDPQRLNREPCRGMGDGGAAVFGDALATVLARAGRS